jgi:hypothetical protein
VRPSAGLAALSGAGCALLGVLTAWGFTVDDALIVTRVAHHLATGHGYRFNADGPIVDAVTPLGYAQLLAPLSRAGLLEGLLGARLLGVVCWLAAAACLGAWSARIGTGARRLLVPLALAACLPLAAWASSGLETGIVLLLATLALLPITSPRLRPALAGAAAAGLAAALRPELVPWAVVLVFGLAWARHERPGRWALCVSLALLPALAVACVREAVFGRPAPLAVFAKPSDFAHGLRYALGALALAGPPWLLVSRAHRRLEPRYWALAAAALVHWIVLLGVGGDWMPLWRLALPTFPALLLLGAALAEKSSALGNAARALTLGASLLLVQIGKGADTRSVAAQRERLSAELRPLIAGATRIATVDVGWVGAASAARIVDLAGVTDEQVALLAGGHTSKRLPRDFLERRRVDALVLLDEPHPQGVETARHDPPRPWRIVEQRLMTLEGAEDFHVVSRLALTPTQDYVVLRRSP